MDQLTSDPLTENGNRKSLVGSRLQLFENICADQDSKITRISVRPKVVSRSISSDLDDDLKSSVNCVNSDSDKIDVNVNQSDEREIREHRPAVTDLSEEEEETGAEDQFENDFRLPNFKNTQSQYDSSFNKRISYNMAVSGKHFGIIADMKTQTVSDNGAVNGIDANKIEGDVNRVDDRVSEITSSAVKDDVEDLSNTKVSECNFSVISSSPNTDNEVNDTNDENCRIDTKSKDEDYPEELNPFGDDDGGNEIQKEECGANPFDSESETEENSTKNESKVNTNPFWSGSEEEEEEEETVTKSLQKTPIPLPRTVKKPIAYISPQPSPKPRIKSNPTVSPASSCRSLQSAERKLSGESLDITFTRSSESQSVNSTLRKKKPAPPPPVAESVVSDKTSNQNHSNEQINNVGAVAADQTRKIKTSPWRNKKGPAPARPIPIRRPVKEMPLEDIKTELSDIDVRRQELERQGKQLEQMIRDGTNPDSTEESSNEELVLQLFELVNEKNELLRRHSELMYMRKMHKLEEEHAEIEYQLRCLMLRPESNKTDSDKSKEEELLNRLLEIVERKNEIVEAMEKDRQRETAEDKSVTTQLDDKKLEKDDKHGKKGKKVKKEKLKDHKEDDASKSPDAKHSPSKVIKQKFMTLRHSAKKLNSKIPH